MKLGRLSENISEENPFEIVQVINYIHFQDEISIDFNQCDFSERTQ